MRGAGWVRALGGGALLAALGGCGSQQPAPAPPAAPGCAAADEVYGSCAGVPASAACITAACAGPAACLQASTDAEVAAALAGAHPGDRLTLAAGTYGAVVLPGGVSLYGAGAAAVTVGAVTLGAGTGATLCGLTVDGGVTLAGAQQARVESVHVVGAPMVDGVSVGAGSSLSLVTSEIDGAGRYGVYARDSGDVRIDGSIVDGSAGPGLWMACGTTGCDCKGPPPKLSLTSSILRGNRIAGVSLLGVAATFSSVEVAETGPGMEFEAFQFGQGLSVAGCSALAATALRVRDNADVGVLVDGSSAALGEPPAGQGVEVTGNQIGVWIQNVSKKVAQTVKLENAVVDGNRGVGVGLAGHSTHIIICSVAISNTSAVTLPTNPDDPVQGGAKTVGYGVSWIEQTQAVFTGVTLEGSALASVLIDGAVGGGAVSSLANVTLKGGDAALGILQQDVAQGATAPADLGNAPAVKQSAARTFLVPLPPAAPASL